MNKVRQHFFSDQRTASIQFYKYLAKTSTSVHIAPIGSTGANQCKYLVMIYKKITSQRPNYTTWSKVVFTHLFLILLKTQTKSSLKKGLPQKQSSFWKTKLSRKNNGWFSKFADIVILRPPPPSCRQMSASGNPLPPKKCWRTLWWSFRKWQFSLTLFIWKCPYVGR